MIILPCGSAQQLDQFVGFFALFSDIATHDGALDAMAQMRLQQVRFDTRERRTYGVDLREDIDAIAIGLDHAANTVHLAFNAVDPAQ